MKLIYCAGPYSAPTRAGIVKHISAATEVAVEVARIGGMPVCPHSMTADHRFDAVQGYGFWIEGTLLLLRVCEAVMLVPGWEHSKGARGEVLEAQELGMPVFQPGDYDGLAWWLRGNAETLPPPRNEMATIREGE